MGGDGARGWGPLSLDSDAWREAISISTIPTNVTAPMAGRAKSAPWPLVHVRRT
jgi:hypothetical protein